MTDTETLEERAGRLEERLRNGFDRIGEMMANHINVTNWEEAWVNLLREYEQINDEIAAHHAAPQPAPVQVALMAMPRAEVA